MKKIKNSVKKSIILIAEGAIVFASCLMNMIANTLGLILGIAVFFLFTYFLYEQYKSFFNNTND